MDVTVEFDAPSGDKEKLVPTNDKDSKEANESTGTNQ
jgi:hypothetical protein